jgi:protein-L-isoaspartate(D-aspartate) O-methyltransferase
MTNSSGNDAFAIARKRMVLEQLAGLPPTVLAAMEQVPRHEFVPENQLELAYADTAVPIGFDQTISQPYIVGVMTAHLDLHPSDRVLEIGTGSGYQSAILAQLVADIYSIEIIEPLAHRAAEVLRRLGCDNVHLRVGDGSHGWPEAAPFDAIIVTCAPDRIPPSLLAQLKEGGRLVIPVGPEGVQYLFWGEQRGGRFVPQAALPVRFVPMTGQVAKLENLQ